MLEALKEMQNDKCPGLDGLSAGFYKFFWPNIKKYLFSSYMTSLDKGILNIFQCRGDNNPHTKKEKKTLRTFLFGDPYLY